MVLCGITEAQYTYRCSTSRFQVVLILPVGGSANKSPSTVKCRGIRETCLLRRASYILYFRFLTTDHSGCYDWVVNTKAESLVRHRICWSHVTNDVLSNT
jgi:hypothetical protein